MCFFFCCSKFQQAFKNAGGRMWECSRVTDIIPESENKIIVKTCKDDVVAKSLVVTAGPWTKQLLSKLEPALPLEVRLNYC